MDNQDIKTDLKKAIKQYLTAVNSKKADSAKTELSLLCKTIDKAAKRKVLAKNTANRRKSKFTRLLQTISN